MEEQFPKSMQELKNVFHKLAEELVVESVDSGLTKVYTRDAVWSRLIESDESLRVIAKEMSDLLIQFFHVEEE